ncbi:uncharacterized protein C9orf153 homolog [Peromyscus californicus insignis]|uniref:uncharacterized protein C9orf153 homolog n=1 Tax=Peromyscus californicus insignis TaxID=564181 RepID=UPI0022A7BBA4|nr:uncharacterized protein C9orf153 homolog [Peromyscus californicus insignis]
MVVFYVVTLPDKDRGLEIQILAQCPSRDITFGLMKLQELYTSAENFNNKSKKSNFQKICGISFEEARQLLGKDLNARSFDSRHTMRKDEPLPAKQTQEEEEEEKPVSMADLLHYSLLTGFLVPVEQLSRSQQRLAQAGIPPPTHSFPYAFRTDEPRATPTPTFRKRIQSTTFHKLLLSSVAPDRLVFEDKSMRFFSTEPGKQFMDLVDLEWRYFKGLARWGRVPTKFSFMDIQFNSEKRFIESQSMPGLIFPPLVRKTLVIYPRILYHKEGHYSLKWDV